MVPREFPTSRPVQNFLVSLGTDLGRYCDVKTSGQTFIAGDQRGPTGDSRTFKTHPARSTAASAHLLIACCGLCCRTNLESCGRPTARSQSRKARFGLVQLKKSHIRQHPRTLRHLFWVNAGELSWKGCKICTLFGWGNLAAPGGSEVA